MCRYSLLCSQWYGSPEGQVKKCLVSFCWSTFWGRFKLFSLLCLWLENRWGEKSFARIIFFRSLIIICFIGETSLGENLQICVQVFFRLNPNHHVPFSFSDTYLPGSSHSHNLIISIPKITLKLEWCCDKKTLQFANIFFLATSQRKTAHFFWKSNKNFVLSFWPETDHIHWTLMRMCKVSVKIVLSPKSTTLNVRHLLLFQANPHRPMATRRCIFKHPI